MIQQQTQEWLDFRKDKIGASDSNIIMQVSPWKTPYQLWLEKMGIIEGYSSPTMQWGLDKEDSIREEFYGLTDIAVIPQVKVHPKYEWMMASLDGLSANGKTAVEIKCHKNPTDYNHVVATKTVPEKYFPQIQHQLEVLGLDSMHYMCFHDGNHCLIEVERDEKFIAEMIPKLKDFHECLINETPPPLTDRDKKLREDESWIHLANEWITVQEELSLLKGKESSLRDAIISECGENSSQGGGIMVTRSFSKGRVDYSLIDELKTVDLDKFRKPHKEVWTIRKQNIS